MFKSTEISFPYLRRLQRVQQVPGKPGMHDVSVHSVDKGGAYVFNAHHVSSQEFQVDGCGGGGCRVARTDKVHVY